MECITDENWGSRILSAADVTFSMVSDGWGNYVPTLTLPSNLTFIDIKDMLISWENGIPGSSFKASDTTLRTKAYQNSIDFTISPAANSFRYTSIANSNTVCSVYKAIIVLK